MASHDPTTEPTIRYAIEAGTTTPLFHSPQLIYSSDVPIILNLIRELAAYENASSSVLATEQSLRTTLSFPPLISDLSAPFDATSGYAKVLLIYPPWPSDSETATLCVGLALFFTNYSTWRGAPGVYLEDLYVKPEYRGKGYGKLLLRALAKETRRIGGQRLDWSVLKWNEPSLKFYQGLGAERMEEWVGMRVQGEALEELASPQEVNGHT